MRLGVGVPAPDGSAIRGTGLATQGGFSPCDLRRFLILNRDPTGPCTTGGNLSNGLAVLFRP